MARIPEFTRQVFLDRVNPGNISAAAAAGGGNAARASMAKAQQYAETSAKMGQLTDQLLRQKAADGQVAARSMFNQAERDIIMHTQDQQNQRQGAPDNFAKDMDTFINQKRDQYLTQARQTGGNFDSDYFSQLMDGARTDNLARNSAWENDRRVKNTFTGTEQNVQSMMSNWSLTNPGLKDLKPQLEKLRTEVNKSGENILAPEDTIKLFDFGAKQATGVVMDSMIENDPQKLNYVFNYNQGTPDQLRSFVADVLEGGDAVVPEPDGGIAKFGINSIAYAARHKVTEAEAKKIITGMSRDDAMKEYEQFYAVDNLPDGTTPEMRTIAYDMKVNGWDPKVLGMDIGQAVEASKGDPNALLALRQQYYDSLVQNNPDKFAKYANGWKNRLNKLGEYVDTMQGGGKDLMEVAGLIDPATLARTKSSIPAALEAQKRQQEAERNKVLSAFKASYKSTFDSMTDNMEPVSVDDLNKLEDVAYQSGDLEAIGQVDALKNTRLFVSSLRSMSDTQLDGTIKNLSAEVNKNGTSEARTMLDIAEKVRDKMVKGIKDNGIEWFARTKQINAIHALDFNNPDVVVAELLNREQSSKTIYSKTGRIVPVLTPQEIDQTVSNFDAMPPDAYSEYLGVMDKLDAGSREAIAIDIAKREGDKSKVIAAAISVDDPRVRRDIIRGMRVDAFYKPAEMQTSLDAVLNSMYVDPSARPAIKAAVEAHYRETTPVAQRVKDSMIDPKGLKASLQAVVAPIADSGMGDVFTFKDKKTGDFVDEDTIYNMFKGVKDKELSALSGGKPLMTADGKPVSASEIKNDARLVSTGDGKYQFFFEDTGQYVIDPNDKNGLRRFTVDANALLDLYKKRKTDMTMDKRTLFDIVTGG